MSETVHFRGKLTPLTYADGETLQNKMDKLFKEETGGDDLTSFWSHTKREYFEEESDNYILINNELFKIETNEVDLDEEINVAYKNNDNTISFETKFYNGGTCLREMLLESIGKLNKDDTNCDRPN